MCIIVFYHIIHASFFNGSQNTTSGVVPVPQLAISWLKKNTPTTSAVGLWRESERQVHLQNKSDHRKSYFLSFARKSDNKTVPCESRHPSEGKYKSPAVFVPLHFLGTRQTKAADNKSSSNKIN